MAALCGFLHQNGNDLHARDADVASCAVRGAASQHILLGLPRLLGALFSCAFCNAHDSELLGRFSLGLSSDKVKVSLYRDTFSQCFI